MSGRAYPVRPMVGLGVVLLKPNAVLLVRRGKAPAAGAWSIPGGAQRLGETAEAGARRELLEESGLATERLTLIANVDSITRDPNGAIEYHYTILDFAARWIGGEARAGGDVTDARFVEFDALEHYGLWSEARRVIHLSRRLFNYDGDGKGTASPD